MDTLDFAINMELEGYRYYTEQAIINNKNELNIVFQILADSEKQHANLLQIYKKQEVPELNVEFVRPSLKSVFHNIKHFQKENSEKQLNAYQIALEQEVKSIELYKEMLDKAAGETEKDLLYYLIGQEEQHYELFNELVKMLTRPEEWVESAEFGIREEY